MAIMRRQMPSERSLIGGNSLQAKINREVVTIVYEELYLLSTWMGSPDTSFFNRPSSVFSILFMSLAMLASLPNIAYK